MQRMGSSRGIASGVLGFVRDLQNLGPSEALRKFHLDELAGRPADEILLQLGEIVGPPGGSIDEGVARNALLEAIADLAGAGLQSFDKLSPSDLIDLFVVFVARSIEGRIVNDIGMKGISLPADTAKVFAVQQQLRDFVQNCVKDALVGKLDNLRQLTDHEVSRVVESIYEATFDVLVTLSESYETA